MQTICCRVRGRTIPTKECEPDPNNPLCNESPACQDEMTYRWLKERRELEEDWRYGWEVLKKAVGQGPITPEQYKEIYDKFRLRELTPLFLGWIGICPVCHNLFIKEDIKRIRKELNLEGCEEVIRQDGECYLFNKKCKTIVREREKCRDIGTHENRRQFLLGYARERAVKNRRVYCGKKCKSIAKSKRWRAENPEKKRKSDFNYLSFLKKEGDF